MSSNSIWPSLLILVLQIILTSCYNNKREKLPAPEEPAFCDDFIQNQGESGVDCGGPCAPCYVTPMCTASTNTFELSNGKASAFDFERCSFGSYGELYGSYSEDGDYRSIKIKLNDTPASSGMYQGKIEIHIWGKKYNYKDYNYYGNATFHAIISDRKNISLTFCNISMKEFIEDTLTKSTITVNGNFTGSDCSR
jgi:hypothetical protein